MSNINFLSYSETRKILPTESERSKNLRTYANGIGVFIAFDSNAFLTCNGLIMKNQL